MRWFGPKAATPIDYVERDWAAEAWTRGCYGAHFPTGAWTRFGPALREPVGPIHWAGTETATPGWATSTAPSSPTPPPCRAALTNWS